MIPFFNGSLLQASLRKTGTPGTHKCYERLGGQWVMLGPGQVRNLPKPKHAKLIENEVPILQLWASMGIPSPRLACACTCETTVTLVAFPHLLPPSCTKRVTATGLEDHLAKLFPFFIKKKQVHQEPGSNSTEAFWNFRSTWSHSAKQYMWERPGMFILVAFWHSVMASTPTKKTESHQKSSRSLQGPSSLQTLSGFHCNLHFLTIQSASGFCIFVEPHPLDETHRRKMGPWPVDW